MTPFPTMSFASEWLMGNVEEPTTLPLFDTNFLQPVESDSSWATSRMSKMRVQQPQDTGVPASGRRTWFVLLLAVVVLAALVLTLFVLRKGPREEIIACTSYDSQIWAQSLFESDPSRYAALDPDGNGLACEELPLGAAPALWTNKIPPGAAPAALISVSDGDTIRVDVGGQVETLRLILIDTPETRDPNNPPEFYGAEATAFLERLLPVRSELYLETDVSKRDRFGRLLRYVWLDRGEEIYLVN